MIQVNKIKAREDIKTSQVKIQKEELGHFTNNLGMISGTASILVGFSFGSLTSMPRKELYMGTVRGRPYNDWRYALRLIFVLITVLSMMLNLSAILISSYASMLAPDLALRGPIGSMERALQQVRIIHQWVIHLFLGGLYCFMTAVMIWGWVYFIVDGSKQYEIDSFVFTTPIFITVAVFISISILTYTVQKLYNMFYHPTLQVDGRKDMFFLRAEKYHQLHSADGGTPKCFKCGHELREGVFCSNCGTNNELKDGVLAVVEDESSEPKIKTRRSGNRVSFLELSGGKLTQMTQKGGKVIRQMDLVNGQVTITAPTETFRFSAIDRTTGTKITAQAAAEDEAASWVNALANAAEKL